MAGPQPKKIKLLKYSGNTSQKSQSVGNGSSKLSDSDSSDDARPSFGSGQFSSTIAMGMGAVQYGQGQVHTNSSLHHENPQKRHWNEESSYSSSSDRGEEAGSFSGSAPESTVQITNTQMADQVAQDYIIKDSGKKKQGVYSDFAGRMMEKMGHKSGTGLGKHGQGRVEIIESSKQKGRRGLGVNVKGFEETSLEWDFEKEEVPIKEPIEWMDSSDNYAVPSLDEMKTWIKHGPKKLKIDDEFEFCDMNVVQDVCECKSIFDNLEGEEMRRARTKSNPYETIRGVFFLNRAAMKMANMDAAFDFMFTNPRDENGRSMIGSHKDLLYFADICAGPGGFSEYVLWRKKWDAKGFGFTLRGPCDFKLEDFYAAPSELFEPHYGVGGSDGDGDIYKPENLLEFQKFVLTNTDDNGVHFVMADGGFSVEGQENLQEILSKRLYLCQFLCALMILRTGGNFVCKLFDLFTPFSVGLVYLMYRAFHRVSIFKPVTSRPANSERYIICRGKRPDSDSIQNYMFYINEELDKLSGVTSNDDIREVVPDTLLKSDQAFYNYILHSNKQIGIAQCIGLKKIQTFASNTDLYERRQSDVREECLKAWQIPDQLRTAPTRNEPPKNRFSSLMQLEDQEYLHEPVKLEPGSLKNKMKSIYDYRCYLSGSEQRCLLFSLGKRYVFQWNGNLPQYWRKLENMQLELPENTILEVEFISEMRGEGKGQRKSMGVHVIDAIFLCGRDIRMLHFTERLDNVRKFVKAIHRPSRPDLTPIRVKDVYKCEDLEEILNRLCMRTVKGCGSIPQLCYCAQQTVDKIDRYFKPTGVCFIKTIKDPWMMAFSRSQHQKYFYHTLSQTSSFEIPKESVADFVSCQQQRLVWSWGEGVSVLPNQNKPEDSRKLSRDEIIHFVHSNSFHRK